MNHISIKRLQCILLKAALVLGVEICPGVEFREVVEPDTEADSWTLGVSPADHPINKRGLDVLIGAEVLSAFQFTIYLSRPYHLFNCPRAST